jgi:hypothetical protein
MEGCNKKNTFFSNRGPGFYPRDAVVSVECRNSLEDDAVVAPTGRHGTASRERNAVQKSANALQQPSWDLISSFLASTFLRFFLGDLVGLKQRNFLAEELPSC